MMTLAFNTGFLIDNVRNAIAFADRLGGTFGYACAAGDAIFGNFHGHGCYSVYKIWCGLKLTDAQASVN
jgi:hypothetical protein